MMAAVVTASLQLARDLEHVGIPFASTARNRPVLQFLLEIADGGHDATEAETVFRLPASEAARVHFDPMSIGQGDEPDRGAEVIEAGRPASSPFQLDAGQLEAVAATARSADDISARLANAAQARARDLSRPRDEPVSVLVEDEPIGSRTLVRMERVIEVGRVARERVEPNTPHMSLVVGQHEPIWGGLPRWRGVWRNGVASTAVRVLQPRPSPMNRPSFGRRYDTNLSIRTLESETSACCGGPSDSIERYVLREPSTPPED
jgi:hypothetical protein